MRKNNEVDVEEVEVVDAETLEESGSHEVLSADVGGRSVSTDLVDERSESNDRLSIAIRSKDDDSSLYDIILEEVAAEASYLKSLSNQTQPNDVASKAILSEKRIISLEKAAKMVSQRSKELKDKSGGKIDFYSDSFQDVLSLMTGLILQAVKETGMQEATEKRFFLKLQQKLTGFEEMAEQAYKGQKSAKKDAAMNAQAFAKTRE